MTELETMQRAKMYMEKLAQGIDPITGQALPEDSPLNNVRLARCFFYVSGILDKVIANDGHIGTKPKVKRASFTLAPQQRAAVVLSPQPIRISDFTDLLYAAAGDPLMRKPSTTTITNWLLEKGFLRKEDGADGKSKRVPTAAGASIGISVEMRQGQYGEYAAVFYAPSAQQFLLDNLDAIFEEA